MMIAMTNDQVSGLAALVVLAAFCVLCALLSRTGREP